ncbi:MAG TPA: hypothetical protein VF041_23070 [Gemmatimonadaceae bacterium]
MSTFLLGGQRYPLRAGSVLRKTPQAPFAATVNLGDSSQVSDLRTAAAHFVDWTQGLGEYEYTESQGLATFTTGDCDTRFQRSLVLRPDVTQLGGAIAAFTAPPIRVEYLGVDNTARLLAYRLGSGNAQLYNATANTWGTVNIPVLGGVPMAGVLGFARFSNRFVALMNSAPGVSASPDATGTGSWPDQNAVLFGSLAGGGMATHDDKLYVLDEQAGTGATRLKYTTRLADAGTVWTTAGDLFYLAPNETATGLVEWRDESGRAALYAVTSQRLLRFSDDAQTWKTFYDFTPLFGSTSTVVPAAHVWRRDGNLYVSFYNSAVQDGTDTVLQFTGSTVTDVGPNRKGGMPAADRVGFTHLVGGLHWLFGWGAKRPTTTNGGRTLAMNQQQGWHTLLRDTGGTTTVIGGGYGEGKLWTVFVPGTVLEQAVPDVADIPANATGRSYYSGTYAHETAWLDLGTPNLPKYALWAEVDCRDGANTTPGLPTGATVRVDIQYDGSGSYTNLGTLTSADTFPAVLPIAGGLGTKFKRAKLKLSLTRGTATTATPNVARLSLHCDRAPATRYAYVAEVDLRASEWSRNGWSSYAGKTLTELRALLEALPDGPRAALAYGGDDPNNPDRVALTAVKVQFDATLDPQTGEPGLYSLRLVDMSYPAPG